MRRPLSTIVGAASLIVGGGTAFAQGGDLAGVTMRVLDDVRDVDAVVIELSALRADSEEGAARDGAARADDASAAADARRAAKDRTNDEPRARPDLHDPDDDERAEGKLEDNDIERPAVPPTP
jgi:hypothetical protein